MKSRSWLIASLMLTTACEEIPGAPSAEPSPALEQQPAQAVLSPEPAPPSIHPAPATKVLPVVIDVQSRVSFEPLGETTVDKVVSARFDLDVTGAEGEHEVAVQIATPSGETYQVFRQQVTGSRSESVPVGFELPVAGTFIDKSALAGLWSARVLVDGEEHSTQTFLLNP